MKQEFLYDSEADFMHHLGELKSSGVARTSITTFSPYPVHGLEEVLGEPPSWVKIFTLTGALTGFMTGLGLTIYTVMMWPLDTGGKPFISLPPFLIIAYVLTILFGALCSFAGFLVLARLPSIKNIFPEKEYGNQFVVVVEKD